MTFAEILDYFRSFGKGCRIVRRAEFLEKVPCRFGAAKIRTAKLQKNDVIIYAIDQHGCGLDVEKVRKLNHENFI
jgi:hypothetical protein